MTGLPGTGKTTAARKFAEKLDAVLLNTDSIRKKIKGKKNRYSKEKKKTVYEKMLEEGEKHLRSGRNVILDGTFYRKELRDRAFSLAEKHDIHPFLVEITSSKEMVKDRIEARKKSGRDASEADFRVYEIIKKQFEPIQRERYVLNTDDENTWTERMNGLVNKMRVIEKQESVIDRLAASGPMRLIQTHISWVLLDGRYAYKIKKPVTFDFVDYGTLEKRKEFCRREIEINSRLSPSIYDKVVSIRRKKGTIGFGLAGGDVVEFAVRMKEMPQETRMDHMLEENTVRAEHLCHIAEKLADFHQRASPAPPEYGTPEKVRDDFFQILQQEEGFRRALKSLRILTEVRSLVEKALDQKKSLLIQRQKNKRIRHCHGDVRLKNIFIEGDNIYIFDAVEFSEKISCCDVAADIAFLAMDLSFHGYKNLSDSFIRDYISASGDTHAAELTGFYQAYRALVRALVESLAAVDPEMPEQKKSESEKACREYIDLAADLLT